MLGCTYNYTDVDSADLENAMSRAIATQAASKEAAQDDHAAAIFGGSPSKGDAREPGTDAEHRPRSRHQHGHSRSPNHSHSHETRDRFRDRHGRSYRSSHHHDMAEPDRQRQRLGYAQDDHTLSSRKADRTDSQRRRDDHQEDVFRERRRMNGDSRPRRSEHQTRDDEHGRGRSRRDGSPTRGREHRGEVEDRYRRRSDCAEVGRARGQESGAWGREHTEHRRQRLAGHRERRSQERVGHATERVPTQAVEAYGRTGGSRHDSTGLAQDACGRGAHPAAPAAGPHGSTFAGDTNAGTHGLADRVTGLRGADSGVQGTASLGAIVPEGAMVVETDEIVRSAREVNEHDALDAAAVLKARGSWREQLRRRKEGLS